MIQRGEKSNELLITGDPAVAQEPNHATVLGIEKKPDTPSPGKTTITVTYYDLQKGRHDVTFPPVKSENAAEVVERFFASSGEA